MDKANVSLNVEEKERSVMKIVGVQTDEMSEQEKTPKAPQCPQN